MANVTFVSRLSGDTTRTTKLNSHETARDTVTNTMRTAKLGRPSGAEHLAFVDGLRAVAVLLVICSHVTVYSEAWRRVVLWPLMNQGHHGVDLFFGISGFCLAYPTLSRIAGGAPLSFDVSNFAAKRIVRIFPPYIIALLLFCLLLPAPTWELESFTGGAKHYELLGTLRETLLFDRFPLHDPSFWTLGIELRWYFVFPLALLLFVRAPAAFGAALLACYAFYFGSRFDVHDVVTLPTFLSGIVAAWIMLRRPFWAKYLPLLVIVALAPMLGQFAWARDVSWTILVFLFIVFASTNRALKRMLSWKPLAAVGIASYSIYLVHEPMIAWAAHWAPPFSLPALAIISGVAFWMAVERPLTSPQRRSAMVRCMRDTIQMAWDYATSGTLEQGKRLTVGASASPQAQSSNDETSSSLISLRAN